MVVLVVYVDDILLTGSDLTSLSAVKIFLQRHFVMKELGRLKYFLRIKIAYSKEGIYLSQRKYVLDLLQETNFLGCKPTDTPMVAQHVFWDQKAEDFPDVTHYRRLVSKLIYLTITKLDISIAIGLLSQFMQKPKQCHWEVVLRLLRYIKAFSEKGLLYKKNKHLQIEAYSDADYALRKSQVPLVEFFVNAQAFNSTFAPAVELIRYDRAKSCQHAWAHICYAWRRLPQTSVERSQARCCAGGGLYCP